MNLQRLGVSPSGAVIRERGGRTGEELQNTDESVDDDSVAPIQSLDLAETLDLGRLAPCYPQV